MRPSSECRSPFHTLSRVLVMTAALFGLMCGTVLLVSPEKIPDLTKSLFAFGKAEYRLPQTSPPPAVNEADTKTGRAFSKIFSDISKQTRPALVYIESSRVVNMRRNAPEDFLFGFPFARPRGPERGVQKGAGSGFIVDLKNGYVLTNSHVVDGMTELRVQTYDNRWFNAKVIGEHKDTDVAVIQLQKFTPQNLKQMSLGESDSVEPGDWVVALGAPFGLQQTLTVGVVSATGRDNVIGDASSLQDFIQTDAAINPGNSGGPLLNIDGKVIGINTAIYSQTGGYAGISFAIPIRIAKSVSESIINNNGKVPRGYLGIAMDENPSAANLPEETKGVVVTKVYPGTPAEKAGIKIYDVVQSVNGQPVERARDLRLKISFSKPGDSITIGLLRDGKKVSVDLRVGDFSDESQKMGPSGGSDNAPAAQRFGLALQELSSEIRKNMNIKAREGVIVAAVDDESDAGSQLQQGDVVLELNRKKVKSPKDLEKILSESMNAGKSLVFLIERDGATQLVVFSKR